MRLFWPSLAILFLSACASVPRGDLLRAEDSRDPSSAALRRGAADSDPGVRRASFRAMGRIQAAAYADPLIRGLRDRDPGVRREAAFSLGQLALGEGEWDSALQLKVARPLALLLAGDDHFLRARALEAIGKTGGPGIERILRWHLTDPEPALRAEAAAALFRLRYLKRIPSYSTETVSSLAAAFADRDPGVRWRAAYAFSRWPEPSARGPLARAASDDELWTRVFAVRALGELKGEAPAEALANALKDPSPAVRAEAVKAAGLAWRPDLLDETVFHDPSPQVRAACADALLAAGARHLIHRLAPLANEESPLVRGQALLALGQLQGDAAAELLVKERTNPHWWVKSRATLASAGIESAREALLEAVQSPDPRVAVSALEALAQSTGTLVEPLLAKILRDPQSSLELRGTAADAARERKSPALIPVLEVAFKNTQGREWGEVKDTIAKAIEETTKAHPEAGPVQLFSKLSPKYEAPELLGQAPGMATVVLETERGEIEIALAGEEAPMHAAAFLKGVRSGLYENTSWHRVVSNFVIQGGDPRGSGWGDAGFSLRDEINPLRFERGAVGMPKAGKDTGGCQVFITHLPTPHLDGRYTVFGRVVRGMEVVDAIEPGDKILRARVK